MFPVPKFTQKITHCLNQTTTLSPLILSCPNCNVTTVCDSINLYDYSKADFDSINEYLSHVDFSPCFNSSDVEFVWALIKDILLD